MRWILISAAILGAASIILGAALKHSVASGDVEILQTALRYHQIHSVVLLALGLFALERVYDRWFYVSAGLFIAGIFIFSGSLYLMVLYAMPVFGNFTPIGGMCFIAGWLSLIFVKINKTQSQ